MVTPWHFFFFLIVTFTSVFSALHFLFHFLVFEPNSSPCSSLTLTLYWAPLSGYLASSFVYLSTLHLSAVWQSFHVGNWTFAVDGWIVFLLFWMFFCLCFCLFCVSPFLFLLKLVCAFVSATSFCPLHTVVDLKNPRYQLTGPGCKKKKINGTHDLTPRNCSENSAAIRPKLRVRHGFSTSQSRSATVFSTECLYGVTDDMYVDQWFRSVP